MTDDEAEPTWGRVLLAGGIHWASNGQKVRVENRARDLHMPHILRSMCHVKVTQIITGQAANYAIIIDVRGNAYIFGKCPGVAYAANTNGIISEIAPLKFVPASFGLPYGAKFVGGAAGRLQCFLLDSEGEVWGCGQNSFGQVGVKSGSKDVTSFAKIDGPWDGKIVQVTTGNMFSLFLSEKGEVYACGSSEAGQLGNGQMGERIVTGNKRVFDIQIPPRRVNGLEGKKIVQIATGAQHSLAMDELGYIWAWGFAGYSRLGLESTADKLVPTLVPRFAGPEMSRASAIACGPTNSVVIDRSKRYFMAGKWKITGDGSTGQPYTSFKPIDDISRCKVLKTSSGGCTHFVIGDLDGERMTIGWGQGVLYGELGLDDTLSSTKPQVLKTLSGIEVQDVAAGAFFTLFLARPSDELSNLKRFPETVDPSMVCMICEEDDESDSPLECEKCDGPFHLKCLKLDEPPEGEWFCAQCTEDQEQEERDEDEVALAMRDRNVKSGHKRSRSRNEVSGGEEDGTPSKRANGAKR